MNISTLTKEPVILTADAKKKLSDILLAISWSEIARNYFGKSVSWFYQKFDGIKGNMTPGGFTPEETLQLKDALLDLSERIKIAANKL